MTSAQDILLLVQAACATYNPRHPVMLWLLAITRNRLANSARRHARRRAHEVPVEDALRTTWGVSLMIFFLSVFLLGFANGSVTSQAGRASIDARIAQEIDAAEVSFTAALIAVDISKLERLLADDFTWVHASGGVEMKDEYLRGVRDTRRYKAFKREGTGFRIYERAAVSSGNVDITVSTQDRAERILRLRYTAVYVLLDGGWRLATWHNTRLAE